MSYSLTPVSMVGELRRRFIAGPYSHSLALDTPASAAPSSFAIREEQDAAMNATANVTFTTGAGTLTTDKLVLIHSNDWYSTANLLAPTGTAGAAWTLAATIDAGTNLGHTKIWTSDVALAGAQTVIVNSTTTDEERYAALFVLSGAASGIDGVASTANGASSTSIVAPTVTPISGQTDDLLICFFGVGIQGGVSIVNLTMPGSMTAYTERDTNWTARCASEFLTSNSATGTRTATSSAAAAYQTVSILVKSLVSATVYQGAVDLTQTPTLSTDGTLEQAGAVSLGATATLTTAGIRTTSGAVALTATPTLAVTPPPIVGAVSLTTSQTLSAAGSVSQPIATTLTVATTLSVGTPVLGAAAATSLVATAGLSVTGVQLGAFAATSLSATGVLSVAGIRSTDGVVALTATPTLTITAFLTEFATVSLSAVATLSSAGRLGAFGAVSMPALGVLAVTLGGVGASATLTTAQSLTVAGQLTATAAIALSTVTTLSVVGVRTTAGLVTLSAVPVLTAGVSVGITNGSATLAALGTLVADGIRIANVVAGGVPLVAVGSLSVNGSTGSGGGTNLIATALLTSSGVRIAIGTTQLTALSALAVGGIAVEFVAVGLIPTVTLSVNGIAIKPGAVSMTAVGLLLASAAIRLAGAVNLIALPSLVFIELFPAVDIFAVGNWTVSGAGLHRGRVTVERPKSGWTTGGIHVGSARS